jgi:LemA protein
MRPDSLLTNRCRAADRGRKTGLYILLGALALFAAWAVLVYNGLVKARNKVDEAWSGVDVQLKLRHDLVPNLVSTVKGYAAHERSTLEAVTEARGAAEAATGPQAIERAEAKLTSALGAVNALAEAYPELRAAESFQRLQAELAEIEDEIQAARRIYNSNVQDYNTRVQVFPTLLIASPMSFDTREFFEIEVAAERAVPKIAF